MRSKNSFQSPIEDSFFSDQIASWRRTALPSPFQSPIEDSFFSDLKQIVKAHKKALRFNPLSRIRSSLTHPLICRMARIVREVSIPYRGFVLL